MPPTDLNFANCHEYEGIPHTSELLQVYEDFHHEKYPFKEICLLKHKCKFSAYKNALFFID